MDSPLISVIIPIYNAERTLLTAMDSVFLQGIRDMEIILVDDGSRDSSLKLCEDYARSDPRIKVISQVNSGPSAARNAGIKAAKGCYLSFVDSDDTLTPGAYAHMLAAAEKSKAEVVIARFNLLIGEREKVKGRTKEDSVLDRDAFMEAFIQKPASFFFACVWNKLYLREMVVQNGILFDHSITWGEDLQFNMHCAYHVRRAVLLKEPVYNYRITLTGQGARSYFLQPGHVLKVRRLQYRCLKDIYRRAGYYRRHWMKIHLFLIDILV